MKNKFTLLVLLAALLVPMTLNAKTKISKNVQAFSNKTEKVAMAKRGDATMPMAVKPSGNIHMLAMPKAEGETLVWDFEDADAGLSTRMVTVSTGPITTTTLPTNRAIST